MLPSSFPITHLSIMKNKWMYRGEGNANLVLALPEERAILRLHKIWRDTPITQDMEFEEMKRVCCEAFFCQTVMVPLLGKAYIQKPTVARVQQKEIYQLDQLLLPERPDFRHHKGIKFGYVNIYPDYALLPERLTQHKPVSTSTLSPALVCSSRVKYSRHCTFLPSPDHSLEDISRLSTTVINVLDPKCVNKNCILSNPVMLNSQTCKIHSINRKRSDSCVNKHKDIYPSVPMASEPTFCVEIKPKQGWIPRSQLHHPKCTFCLNQYLKLSKGAISKISHYCPLDLFSGEEKRMKKAIKALLRTPQNNLKIFKDGHLVYSDEKNNDLIHILHQWLEPSSTHSHCESLRLLESFSSLVQHALTTNLLGDVDHPPLDDQFFPLIYSPHRCSTIMDSDVQNLQPCDLSLQPLPNNCILDRILWIQKLQQYDTDTIHRMLWQYQEGDDYGYVTKLRNPDSNQLSLDPIQRYLLATTAKDCSILIAFQRLRDKNSVALQHIVTDPNSGAEFVFNIGVSDLDPKPLSCIEKHRKRDEDIQYACTRLLASSTELNGQSSNGISD